MSLDLQALIGKLNPICRKGLERAAQLCLSQTHYNVEIEHLLLSLADIQEADIIAIFRHYDIDLAALKADLTRASESFKRGNTRTPALSQHILKLLEQAWLISSLHFGSERIGSGSILMTLLDNDGLRWLVVQSAPGLKNIPKASITKDIPEIVKALDRGELSSEKPPDKAETVSEKDGSLKTSAKTPSLDQFTIDMTQRAKDGLTDPIQGRESEIRQIIDILTRRRQNNPILTGEAGVGKTAIVEGFALRIVKCNVPPALKNVSLRLLDLGLLQAGAGIRGEFEKRLKSVIDEVKSSAKPIILFVDEAHTLIGAGGPSGTGDAANLLKPALARGELRTIAATTWSEYKKYFEKDPALSRRFQVVQVSEPTESEAVEMVRGLIFQLEKHHQVIILHEAVNDAVRLSNRYISGRFLPDKAISVLDTACARVAVAQHAAPSEIENVNFRIEQVNLELSILKRETASGADHAKRIAELTEEAESLESKRKELDSRWAAEKEFIAKLLELRQKLEKEDSESLKDEFNRLKSELRSFQGQTPMIHLWVDAEVIADVISDWTGIPVGKMLTDEINTILNLKDKMEERIIGQSQAIDTVARRIHTFRANLDDPGKPAGVFLLVGSSGIGKTETALALADILYGGERNMITINMSEYQEAHTVSGLKGSPPGYVGYGQGGILTEAVRQKPYSVVLLDEVEKAHPDVMELFYQVFDKGTLEDAEGVSVNFKNTIILLTSNIGSDIMVNACADPENLPDSDTLIQMIWSRLLKRFKPAFLGRLVVVPYYPLQDNSLQKIVRLKLNKIKQRFKENHKAEFIYSDSVVKSVASRCTEVDTGARNADHILTHTLLPELAGELLRRMAVGESCDKIHVDMNENGDFAYNFV